MPFCKIVASGERPTALLMAKVVSMLAAWFAFAAAAQPAPSASSSPPGRAVAEKYCTACHLLPQPEALTKTAWVHQIMPEMAKWLGLERVDYESLPDGRLLEEAKLFPATPIIPEADWFSIWDYYRGAAPSVLTVAPGSAPAQVGLPQFKARVLNPLSGAPMISLVRIDATNRRLHLADAFAGIYLTLDPLGHVQTRERLASPAVALTSGQRRTYLTLIGRLFPSDAEEGAVWSRPDQPGRGAPRPMLEHLRRPTDALALDLNQDGREDFAVCQFGNRLGRFSWFENQGEGRFEEHVLIERPGSLAVRGIDLTRDGRVDLVVMTAQAWEGVYLFENLGGGKFRQQTLIEKPPYWGFSGFDLVDLNQDGRVDLLVVNGDNGDFALPTKPYQGIRIYLNNGTNGFAESFFYPLPGAYKAIARDFDGDGDLDLAAIAFYPDFSAPAPQSFVYFENEGGLKFTARTLPEARLGRWMTMDAGDLDGDGDDDLVLGSFVKGPTTVPVPLATRDEWRTNGAALLLLENQRRRP